MSEFIDHLRFTAHAGDGGNGCASFRREKYVPKGGPDGGHGGRGGHVVLRASSALSTLAHSRPNSVVRAERGVHGSGNNRKGAQGDDQIIRVPVGTVVFDAKERELLADLDEDGAEYVVASGGKGGLGNSAFVTARNQAPRVAKPGEPGERRLVELELKLLADVGIIGLPNAGKSTLTATISSARPKVAGYPFTTLVPVLGVVALGHESYVAADIPGLIEGAHEGVGLGHSFLRHIERTRLLLHLMDVGSPDAGDPEEALDAIDAELKQFNDALELKPQLVAATKIDLNPSRERLDRLRAAAAKRGRGYFEISAATGAGVEEIKLALLAALKELREEVAGCETAETGGNT